MQCQVVLPVSSLHCPATHSALSLLPAMTVLVLLGVVRIQVCDLYSIILWGRDKDKEDASKGKGNSE